MGEIADDLNASFGDGYDVCGTCGGPLDDCDCIYDSPFASRFRPPDVEEDDAETAH